MGTSHRYDCMCLISASYPSVLSSLASTLSANAHISANTPGLSFPSNTSLTPYAKARKNDTSSTGKSLLSKSEHLLHTSSHAKIDYTAREEEGRGVGGLLQHYLGVYDPQSGQLQLVRARKLVLRGSVRPVPSPGEEAVKQTSVSASPPSQSRLFQWVANTKPNPLRTSPHATPLASPLAPKSLNAPSTPSPRTQSPHPNNAPPPATSTPSPPPSSHPWPPPRPPATNCKPPSTNPSPARNPTSTPKPQPTSTPSSSWSAAPPPWPR